MQMTIEVCGWRIGPYQNNGKRCWQLFRGASSTAQRYYEDLGKALRFVAEYALRNDEEGVADIAAALDRYEEIAASIERAAIGGES